jgi:hypothetical protein
MRRLLGVAAARGRAGLQGREMEPAGLVGSRPAKGRKALGRQIGLPQLGGGIRHRIAVTVEHRSGLHDMLALGAEPRQIGPFRMLDQVPEGSDRLASGGRRHRQPSIGVASRRRSTTSLR